MEDWTCLGQHKRHPEFPVVTRESRRNSRKTTWLPRHRKMKPFPATASREKSHVRNWRSKGHLAPLMRPTKFPEIPVSLERTPDDRQSRLHLGLLWLASGNPGACTDSSQSPSPRPTPCLAGHHACASAHGRTDRCAQTGHLSCSLIPWVYLCLGVGLLNHTLLPLLVPSGTSIIFSIPALPTPIPTHRGGEFPLLHIFSSIGY